MSLVKKFRVFITTLILLTILFYNCSENSAPTENAENQWLNVTENVNGTLTTLQNLRVLKLYGSHYEIGYAHGYLLGPEIFERQESTLLEEGLLDFYENQVMPNIDQVYFPDEYFEEIRGNFDGIASRTSNGIIYSEVLGRTVNYDDAIALNCLSAFASRGMCSSISAWGDMTYDGSVITAYNHDCPTVDGHTGNWYVIVRVPNAVSGAIPSVCVGEAGDMNVHTAMNLDGTTLSCQGINNFNPPTTFNGFSNEGIIFRKLIESVTTESPTEDIENILNDLFTIQAEALMMSWSNLYNNTHGVALEIDGNLSQNHGYSIRYPNNHEQAIVQTNHFRIRYELLNEPCTRYNQIKNYLDSISSGEEEPLTIESAWNLISTVQIGGDILTEIAVVFEPEKKLMHVALAESGINAHECNRVTLNIEDLTELP